MSKLCTSSINVDTKKKRFQKKQRKLSSSKNPDKLKIIATLPVDEELVKKNLSANNLKDIIKEFDQKMGKLDDKDKSEVDEEFQKLCKLNYFIPIASLPETLQTEIWESDVINFLSVAPAYKASSISTKWRQTL